MKTKRIVVSAIIMVLAIMLFAGFKLAENVNSALIHELESEGFSKISENVWTITDVTDYENELTVITAWFDVDKNYGVVNAWSYTIDENGNKTDFVTEAGICQWNYEINDFEAIEIYGDSM